MPNGISHCCQLDQSISILRVVGWQFYFYSIFDGTLCKQTDQTPRFVASDLGLRCLHISHKKDARLIWVNLN